VTVEPASKRCSTCKQDKPLEAFNRLTKAPDGRQYSCRECNRRYHETNKQRHNAQIRERSRRLRSEIREWIRGYLSTHPCVDCGETDPVVLEFDHLRDKVRTPSARWCAPTATAAARTDARTACGTDGASLVRARRERSLPALGLPDLRRC
jgi:hypothetical protein